MAADRLTVFVSYSRGDAAFADEIEAGLEYDGGFDVLLDRHDIHEGEDWKRRLAALIAQADTVVFVLSPRSAASPICRWEVDYATSLSKRIVPIQAAPLGDVAPPPALAALNYVRFDEGRSFMAGLSGLRRALKTDIDWLREHTRLLTRAQEWQAAARAENRLLSGSDIVAAKAWLDHVPADGLQPTDLHRDFIQASDRAEVLRLSAERERAQRLERAVGRTRRALAIAVVLAAVATGLGLYAWSQQRVASSALTRAEKAAADAAREKENAERSAFLAQAESERADQFVNLVSRNPAGRRAMEKICLEAIQVTGTLATTRDRAAWQRAQDRFWELYYASMYIVELHQRKQASGGSLIERNMIAFDRSMKALDAASEPLPRRALCGPAKAVRDACAEHLTLPAAPEPCRP